MSFRDSHPRVRLTPCRADDLAERVAVCKEKQVRGFMGGLLISLVYPKSATRSFRKCAEFFDLVPNQRIRQRQEASAALLFGLADAEADVADGFAAETLL